MAMAAPAGGVGSGSGGLRSGRLALDLFETRDGSGVIALGLLASPIRILAREGQAEPRKVAEIVAKLGQRAERDCDGEGAERRLQAVHRLAQLGQDGVEALG